MVYEPNESKLSNLLASFDNLPSEDFEGLKQTFFDVVRELERVIGEQEKAIQALQKRLEDHEVLAPEFCKKEAEFQKLWR